MIFGNAEKPALAGISDIGWREALIFAPLVVLTILFGVFPKPVLDMSAASVDAAARQLQPRGQPPSKTRRSRRRQIDDDVSAAR